VSKNNGRFWTHNPENEAMLRESTDRTHWSFP